MNITFRWQVAIAVAVVAVISLTVGAAAAIGEQREGLSQQREAIAERRADLAAADLAALWHLNAGRLAGLDAAMASRSDSDFPETVASMGVLQDLQAVALRDDEASILPPGTTPDSPWRIESGAVVGWLEPSSIDAIIGRHQIEAGEDAAIRWAPEGDGRIVDGLGGVIIAEPTAIGLIPADSARAMIGGRGIAVAGTTLVVGALAAMVIVRPVDNLSAAADGLAKGDHATWRGPKDLQAIATHMSTTASELEARSLDLRERDHLIGALFQGISHDVKGPLISATGFVGRLEREQLPPRARLSVGRAADNLGKVSHAVEQMIAFAQALRPAAIAPCPLTPIVAEAVASARQAASLRGRTVRLEGEAGDVACDPQRLRQALGALIDNGWRHGGDVLVTFEDGIIRIADDGPGIAQPIETLLEPYTARRAEPGVMAGMGIAIAHRMLVGMGARLDIHSSPQGTDVYIILKETP